MIRNLHGTILAAPEDGSQMWAGQRRIFAVKAASGDVSVPAACPMRWSTEDCHGHSRTTPQASWPGLTHVSLATEET